MNTFIFILSIVVVVICLLIVPTIIIKRKKLLIYNTPAVVVEIKKIAEFVTTCFFEEKIMIERKPKHKLAGFILDKLDKDDGILFDELCLIAKGQVRIGYNLKNISEENIRVSNKILYITLPQVEILDVIINPKGWDFYVEDGEWTEQDVKDIKAKAKDEVIKDAIQFDVLQKAKESGEAKIRALLMSFGFKDVIIQ